MLGDWRAFATISGAQHTHTQKRRDRGAENSRKAIALFGEVTKRSWDSVYSGMPAVTSKTLSQAIG